VRTLVVGVGNDDRGDDGAGLETPRRLAAVAPEGVDVLVYTGDPLGLLDVWEGVDRLVLIDAVVSGALPGALQRFDDAAPFRTGTGPSSHGVGVADVLALARALGRAPDLVEVWGIEGTTFALGAPLSPAVAAAADVLSERLRHDLARPREDVPHC
jgi:hydrogenase maturation protease